jgi:hypothetical protein
MLDEVRHAPGVAFLRTTLSSFRGSVRFGAALCACALCLLGGCAKPRQLGGSIAVNEAGLAGRIDAFCRLQDGAPQNPNERQQCLGEPLD